MWAKSLIVVFVIFLTFSKACEVNKVCDINMDDGNIQAMKQSIETFTLSLMNVMYSDTTLEGNVSFSAINVYIAAFLLMTAAADNAKNELIQALGLVDKDLGVMQQALVDIVNGLEVLNTANIRSQEITVENLSLGEAIFIQSGLNPIEKFNELLRFLDADLYSKDFGRAADWATKKINQWINNQTGKRTPITITSTLDPATKLFVSTGVFFSAKWQENFFDPAHSGLGTFTSAAGQTNVVMMSTTKRVFYYDDQSTFAAVQLPFLNPNFMLHVILPYGFENPADFVKNFNMDIWSKIVNEAKEVDMTVKLPKFALAWTSQINEELQALKIKQVFQGTTFPGMIEYADGQLHVSSMTQSAGFTINELGVSMPDITPVSTTPTPTNGPNNPPAFIMDRPCLFLVRHIRSGLIVFSSFVRQL